MIFKIGDAVIGNTYAHVYSITHEGWKGVVTDIISDHSIVVTGVNGLFCRIESFRVDACCFDIDKTY